MGDASLGGRRHLDLPELALDRYNEFGGEWRVVEQNKDDIIDIHWACALAVSLGYSNETVAQPTAITSLRPSAHEREQPSSLVRPVPFIGSQYHCLGAETVWGFDSVCLLL